jgi:hypothetical protein
MKLLSSYHYLITLEDSMFHCHKIQLSNDNHKLVIIRFFLKVARIQTRENTPQFKVKKSVQQFKFQLSLSVMGYIINCALILILQFLIFLRYYKQLELC